MYSLQDVDKPWMSEECLYIMMLVNPDLIGSKLYHPNSSVKAFLISKINLVDSISFYYKIHIQLHLIIIHLLTCFYNFKLSVKT